MMDFWNIDVTLYMESAVICRRQNSPSMRTSNSNHRRLGDLASSQRISHLIDGSEMSLVPCLPSWTCAHEMQPQAGFCYTCPRLVASTRHTKDTPYVFPLESITESACLHQGLVNCHGKTLPNNNVVRCRVTMIYLASKSSSI